MIRKTCLIFFVSLFAILIAVSCSAWPRQYNDDGVSDEDYIRIAAETEEARAFLDQFPEAEILVDRSSKLAVDLRFDKVLPATTEQPWEGIRLRVFIDPETKRAEDTFIQCSDHGGQSNFVEEELIDYLEQYVQSQSCP
jgi:hypothetical protein